MISRQGDRLVVDGPVTFATVGKLLAQDPGAGSGALVVDLAGVTAADSAALGLLLDLVRRARAAGRNIEFVNAGAGLLSLAQLYGVADLIPLRA
ncbi:MAG TPA: STAS domain-containing protein [Burkholderiales bacterium]|nr:STAS domain-containing protein [Burkholderiales bacterium]